MHLPWAVEIIAALAITASIAISLGSLYTETRYWSKVGKTEPTGGVKYPSVTVIMPIRGVDQGLVENILSVVNQKYPAPVNYIFVADDPNDEGISIVRKVLGKRTDVSIIFNYGGLNKGSALAKGIEAAKGDVVVIADSDVRVHNEWLAKLVKPLNDPAVGAVTTYRLYIPSTRISLSSILRSSFNMIGITAMQNETARFTWGGSSAFRRNDLERWNITKYLPHYLSDDYVFTHMVHKDGLRIVFIPDALVLTLEDVGILDSFKWAVRQLWYVKVYGFSGFALYAASYTVLAITLPLSIALATMANALYATGILPYILGVFKDYYRLSRIRSLNEYYGGNIPRRIALAIALASPLNVYFSWLAIITAALSRSINWRGRLFSVKDVEEGKARAPLP